MPTALGAITAAAPTLPALSMPAVLGAADPAAMNHVQAIHAPVWFPPEDHPPLAFSAADPTYALLLEDQASARIPPITPPLPSTLPSIPALGPIPLVTTAPAVQENFLPEEAPY
ncbi:unnamed protein product [Coccothraustes coccothraustes]